MAVYCRDNIFILLDSEMLKSYYEICDDIPEINPVFFNALTKLNSNIDKIEEMIERYNLYDFFDFPKEIKYRLCDKLLPLLINSNETYNIDIIIRDFPILFKYPQYKDYYFEVENFDEIKHSIPHYHEYIKQFDLIEYIKSNNEIMLRYLLNVLPLDYVLDCIINSENINIVDIFIASLEEFGISNITIINKIVTFFGPDLIYKDNMKRHLNDIFPSTILLKNIPCLEYILDFDISDIQLVIALKIAFHMNNLEIVKLIISKKPFILNYDPKDFIMVCISTKNIENIKYLLSNFPNVNLQNTDITSFALFCSNIETLEYLVTYGFKVDNSPNSTILLKAITDNNLPAIELLLNLGIDFSSTLKYSISVAFLLEKYTIYEYLKRYNIHS